MIRASVRTILTMLILPTVAAAQDTVMLRPMVVTASRFPTPLDNVAGAMSVLDGAALRERGFTQVLDALRQLPGLHVVQSGGAGTVASLFVRGGESDYVRVLVDGVPLNQPGGSVDLSGLSLDNVERIEILRGPSSVLYGSDAVAGVVHVITRSAWHDPAVTMSTRAGSYGTTVTGLEAAARTGGWAWSAGGSRTATDGVYDLNSRWTSTNAAASVAAQGRAADARLSGRLSRHSLRYPTDFTGAPTDSNQFSKGDQRHLSLDAGRAWSGALETRLLLGWHSEDLDTRNTPDSPAETDSSRNQTGLDRLQADLRANLRLSPAAIVTGGVVLERQDFDNRLTFGGSFGPSGDSIDARRTSRALYAQALLEASPGASITLGARYEESRGSGAQARRLHSAATWRAGASLRLGAATRLRAAAGTAFKEPTFFEQLGGGFSAGNPDLEPERSTSVEIGIEHWLVRGRLQAGATAFAQRFRDMVQYTFAVAPGAPNYSNISGATSRGLELESRWIAGARATVWARYTLLRTEVTDSSPDGSTFAQGERLLRRPAASGGAGLDLRPGPALRLDASVNYTGERDDLDFVNPDPVTFQPRRVTLPAYFRLDAGGSWEVLRRLALTLRIENLLDEGYEEVLYYPARGRTVLAGGRLSFGGPAR